MIVNVQHVAQRIAREADANQPIPLGIAERKDTQTGYEAWLDEADAACYDAKDAGKNTFRVSKQ